MPRAIIISGPTAAGKTAKSIEIARQLNAEIISCDSVQVYKYMDIGSAKADATLRAEIPHHLIDVCPPDRQFSVGEYAILAKKALDEIFKKGKDAVVVGGSGFYLKAWFAPVFDDIEISADIKNYCASLSDEDSLKKLLLQDPQAAETIDIQNPRRVRPALERVLASGLTLKNLSQKFAEMPCPMGEIEREFIMVDLPDCELFERIKQRTSLMLSSGLIEETKRLAELGFEKNPSAANSVGYRETLAAIRNNDFSNLEADIISSTKKLVKKQRKFFKNALFKNARISAL